MHSHLPFKLVADNVHKMWDKYGLQKVFLQDKGLFLFKFADAKSCSKAPVWVKFQQVLMSYWTPKGLSYIASGIGKPLFVDKLTEKLEPMNFTRICIEISSSAIIPDKLDVVVFDEDYESEKEVEVRVEYQRKPQSCSHYKSFGHSLLKCPRANFQWVPKPPDKVPDVFPLPSSNAQLSDPIKPFVLLENVKSTPSKDLNPVHGDDWTVISKGSKQSFSKDSMEYGACSIPVICNSYMPISPVVIQFDSPSSDVDFTPRPTCNIPFPK